MRRILAVFLCLFLCAGAACAEAPVSPGILLGDLADAYMSPSEETLAKLSADEEALGDPLMSAVAEQFRQTWLNPEGRLLMYGTDAPEEIPVTGRHAFVVLGYALEKGNMTKELGGRCDAAAAAARAFPDSILICTGGATGGGNAEHHTEAGVMKEYLAGRCGIDPDRIFTEERAMSTDENMIYSMEILREQQIETATVITSDYHQLRGQWLLRVLAAKVRLEEGYSLQVVGNYCWPAEAGEPIRRGEFRAAMAQLNSILQLPDEENELLWDAMRKYD